jgi:hypothetical protein
MQHLKIGPGILLLLIWVNCGNLRAQENKTTVSKYNFKFHEIDSFRDRMGATALLDMDKDGDKIKDIVSIAHQTLLPPGGSRSGPFGLALKTWVEDMNNDGMLDIVQAEADTEKGRVFWWENNKRRCEFLERTFDPGWL